VIAPTSKILAAGSVRLLDGGEVVIGQPTAILISGFGFSLQAIAAVGAAVLTFEDPTDLSQIAMVASVSHPTDRRVVAVEQTSDVVKTLFVRDQAAAQNGGTVDFLAIRV